MLAFPGSGAKPPPCPPQSSPGWPEEEEELRIADQASNGSGSESYQVKGDLHGTRGLESVTVPIGQQGKTLRGVSTTEKTNDNPHGELHLLQFFPASQGGCAWPLTLALWGLSCLLPFQAPLRAIFSILHAVLSLGSSCFHSVFPPDCKHDRALGLAFCSLSMRCHLVTLSDYVLGMSPGLLFNRLHTTPHTPHPVF